VGGTIIGQVLKTGARTASSLVLLALVVSPASADWQNFRGARDGLADNLVYGILEDASGAMWFGTPKGASRFDGVRWTTERDSLPNVTVRSLTQDHTGAYWFGTENGGVVRFDGTHWTRFSSPEFLRSNQVEAILEDHRGDLWFGTPAGLTRYQPGTGTWSTDTAQAGGLVHSFAWRLAEDHDFNLWIATPEGASRLDSTRTVWESFTATPGALARDSVLSLAVDSTGGVWFGTDQGAFRYAGGTWAHFMRLDGIGDDVVTSILTGRMGRVWFGGIYSGISCYDGRVWRQYRETPDGGYLGRILAMHQDRSGNLWAATAASGLYRYDGVAWRNYFSTSSTCVGRGAQSAPFSYVLGGNCIQSMLLDHRGDLWFATYAGGVSRYDHAGQWSTFRRQAGRPIADSLNVLFEDRAGELWFGSSGGGVARFDSARAVCAAFTREAGLASDTVYSVFQDRAGDLWFGTASGTSRYDGASWNNGLTGSVAGYGIEVLGTVEDAANRLWFRTSDGLYQLDAARTGWRRFGTADGLPADEVTAMVVDAAGRVVVGTPMGLSWYDGPGWTTLTSFGAAHDSVVKALFVDHSGHLWVGLDRGAATYDGSGWTYYPRLTFPSTPILGLFEDDLHTMWLATNAGLARFNGDTWRTYDSRGDGLASDQVTGFLQDAVGHLWFASNGGLTEHEPYRVAPQSAILSAPDVLTVYRDAVVVCSAASGEFVDVEFSTSFDGAPVSPWGAGITWRRGGISDGRHSIAVWSRDWLDNADVLPIVFSWEVDATPPNAILSSPVFGQPVRGVLEVRGSATDPRFRSYRVDARPVGATHWSIPIDSSTATAGDTLLASWDTRTAGEGDYDLRLAVLDTLGLAGVEQVAVIVDNAAPWADVTTPARVSALNGGDVYTTNQEIHLYFPPRAFPDDAVVSVTPADPPPTTALPPAAAAVATGYGIAWSVGPLAKTATLEFALPDSVVLQMKATPAIYLGHGDEGWTRLGGTYDPLRRVIGAPITGPGRYAIVLDAGAGSGSGGLSALELTPRVFSPAGGFAGTSAAISFTLARPASTTVTVFNRAGRRVRNVMSGRPLGAGANLIHWDGRNEDGSVVEDGMYLVAIEALVEVRKRTVAVVR